MCSICSLNIVDLTKHILRPTEKIILSEVTDYDWLFFCCIILTNCLVTNVNHFNVLRVKETPYFF